MSMIKTIVIWPALLAAFLIVNQMDYEDAIKEEQHYCEMRKIWEESKQIDSQFRPGWPNFKPEVKCP